jgi:hypothetical protein
MTIDQRLAAIVARASRGRLRTMLGQVTSVTPLLVHPENAKAGTVIGPLAYVRVKPKLTDEVALIQVPGQEATWVVIGRADTGGGLVLFYVGQDPVTFFDVVRYRRWAADTGWSGASDLYPDGTAPSCARDDLNDAGGLSEPSQVTPHDRSTSPLPTVQSPHIFRMSDGYTMQIDTSTKDASGSTRSGIFVYLRTPAGAWDDGTLIIGTDATGDPEHSVWTRHGDTIFGGSTNSSNGFLHRLDYSGGAFVQTTVAIGTAYVFAPYYDATNDLVHLYYFTSRSTASTGRLSARNPATLAEIYQTAAAAPNAISTFGYPDDWNFVDVDGDGTGSFFLCCGDDVSGTPRVFRVTAGPSSYSVAQETGIPASGGTFIAPIHCRWDGTALHLFGTTAHNELSVIRRTAQDTYSGWTAFADYYTNDPGFSACTIKNGGVARLAFYRGISSLPSRVVDEATVAAA